MRKIAQEKLGMQGKLISWSKSAYRTQHPDNFVIFNGNVCTRDEKIWFGDLDLTLEKKNILDLSADLKTDLFVFYEMDARFENEESFVLSMAAVAFHPDGTYEIRESIKPYVKL